MQVSPVAVDQVISEGVGQQRRGQQVLTAAPLCVTVPLSVTRFVSALRSPRFCAAATAQPSLLPPTAAQQMATSGLKGLMQHRLSAVCDRVSIF